MNPYLGLPHYFDLNALCLILRDIVALIGVAIIFIGAIYSIYRLLTQAYKRKLEADRIRLEFGRSIILGLEFLVGADIIASVIEPDYYTLGILMILVVIRATLSFMLSVEITQIEHSSRRGV